MRRLADWAAVAILALLPVITERAFEIDARRRRMALYAALGVDPKNYGD